MAEPPARAGIARHAAEAVAASAGMVLFALTVHSGLPWTLLGAVGLVAAAAAIGLSLAGAPSACTLLGIARPSANAKTLLMIAAGLLVGGGLAVVYRLYVGLAAVPAGGLEAFVLLACLIGAAEEVVYRGYVQGRLSGLGWPAAVVLAAAAHAAYKTALFALPATPYEVNYLFMAAWTLLGGIAFGMLRQFSGSLAPPVAAHAAFDLVVYGAMAEAPWWVWG